MRKKMNEIPTKIKEEGYDIILDGAESDGNGITTYHYHLKLPPIKLYNSLFPYNNVSNMIKTRVKEHLKFNLDSPKTIITIDSPESYDITMFYKGQSIKNVTRIELYGTGFLFEGQEFNEVIPNPNVITNWKDKIENGK